MHEAASMDAVKVWMEMLLHHSDQLLISVQHAKRIVEMKVFLRCPQIGSNELIYERNGLHPGNQKDSMANAGAKNHSGCHACNIWQAQLLIACFYLGCCRVHGSKSVTLAFLTTPKRAVNRVPWKPKRRHDKQKCSSEDTAIFDKTYKYKLWHFAFFEGTGHTLRAQRFSVFEEGELDNRCCSAWT
jgi:hypothetical protein